MKQIKNKNKHLSGRQIKAIPIILQTDSYTEAARQIGVRREAIYRWLKDEQFKEELHVARREMVKDSFLRIQRSANDAIATLVEVCRDKEAPPSARVSAAGTILNYVVRSFELEDVESRLETLEISIKHKKGTP